MRCGARIAVWLALVALPACDHVGAGPADGGAADVDTDTDSDTDTDADPDPCADVQPYCCDSQCPCPDAGDRCVLTAGSAGWDEYGVCKPYASGGECWITHDCADGEFCAGGYVCPCETDCSWEGTGVCAPLSGACCEGSTTSCPDDYFCLALDGTDTCHGILVQPLCWTDDDCNGGFCEGAALCACDVDCVSEPGQCAWEEM
jgi:hypothetical protein